MKLCILGSGSSGNSIYVECDGFALLIDVGLSARELTRRLVAVGSDLSRIRGILVSHEHHDHVSGLPGVLKRHRIPLYATRQTAMALFERGAPPELMGFFRPGRLFSLGPFDVHPFAIPHDALDPVGFILAAGGHRIGIATDLGSAPDELQAMLRGCRALVIESNHDADLLANGTRPLSLKRRIRSAVGHLSNDGAAALLAAVASHSVTDVFLAHLSQECNRPEHAVAATMRALRERGCAHVSVRLTYADRVSDVVDYHAEPNSSSCPAGAK